MAEFPTDQEHLLIKQLISTYRCTVCRRSFEREQVRVAARHEQLWIVSVRCSRCRHQQRFWLALREGRDEEVLRDVTAPEEDQFAGMDPVSADNVLDMHEFLRDFDGDFSRLFGD